MQNDVFIVYNKELINLFCNVDVGNEIFIELYEVVVYVIVFLIDLDKKR